MVFLTIIIVLVSGLIAYMGDLIGRKMGRKRLSLFGLRPRYTAIVISIGIGMLIAALTLSVTFAISKRVRDAFFTPIEHLRAELSQLHVDLNASRGLTTKVKSDLTQRTHELNDTEDKRLQISEQYAAAHKNLTQTQHDLDALNKRLTGVKQQLAEVQQNEALASRKIFSANSSILDLRNEQLALQADIKLLRAEKATFETAMSEFAKTNFAPLVFEQGQEILTGLFPTKGSDRELHKLLARYFDAAIGILRQRSPKMPAADSAILFYRTPAHENEPLAALSANEAIDLLAQRIRGTNLPGDVLVQLVPANNVRINGPAMIVVDKLTVLQNSKAYEQGSEVAHVLIPEHASPAEILGKLADDLLHSNVPRALREKKMPMIIQRFAPDVKGMVVTSPSKISWTDLFAAMEEARKLRGAVIVTAKARTALHYFDPLDLTLDVTPAKL